MLSFNVEPSALAQKKWDAGFDEFGNLAHTERTKLLHLFQEAFTVQHFVNTEYVIRPNGMIPVIL